MRNGIYLSGPVQGYDAEERMAHFTKAAENLTMIGHVVVNPLTIAACEDRSCLLPSQVATHTHSWECYLRHDILAMLGQCDNVALLPGWMASPGSRLEAHLAIYLGFEIWTHDPDTGHTRRVPK